MSYAESPHFTAQLFLGGVPKFKRNGRPSLADDSESSATDANHEDVLMITRLAKAVLLCGIALFYTLVVINNLTDFDSNYQFVRHVLMMDSTFPGNHGLWRAVRAPTVHLGFYISIIAWEIVTVLLLWWGVVQMLRALKEDALSFNRSKRAAIVALTLSMMMWLVAFLSVGAEWFLMWQSHTWNGQEAAFRMFAVVGLVLLLLLQPDSETQP